MSAFDGEMSLEIQRPLRTRRHSSVNELHIQAVDAVVKGQSEPAEMLLHDDTAVSSLDEESDSDSGFGGSNSEGHTLSTTEGQVPTTTEEEAWYDQQFYMLDTRVAHHDATACLLASSSP